MLSPALLAALIALQAAPAAPTPPPSATPSPAPSPTPGPAATPDPTAPVESDWMTIPDDELMVMTLSGRRHIVIRLAPRQAPVHVANIRALALAHWWDGTSVNRVQDNYVVQWGDASEGKPLPPGITAAPPPEYERAGWEAVTRLTRPDPFAPRAGHTADGWQQAGNARTSWMPHCYGALGVGRGLAPDTGTGAELYAVIGSPTRPLDRNIAVVGRVIDGIEHLSSLPRCTGPLGFYERPEQRVVIERIRLASDLPPGARPRFHVRRTDNARFAAYLRGRENRTPPFFDVPAGGADICTAPVQVRRLPEPSAP